MIKYQKILKLLPLFFLFFWAMPAKAVCPVCTVAVGAGVGMARYLGIEDTITGVWIGGLIMSLSFWTIIWLNRKNWRFSGHKLSAKILIILGYYLITVVPLYFMGIVGHPINVLCGIDKIILGSVVGSTGFIIGVVAHSKLKARNNDKVYFPFQKVALSVAPLLILSLMFYIISKC